MYIIILLTRTSGSHRIGELILATTKAATRTSKKQQINRRKNSPASAAHLFEHLFADTARLHRFTKDV